DGIRGFLLQLKYVSGGRAATARLPTPALCRKLAIQSLCRQIQKKKGLETAAFGLVSSTNAS
ncbi:hypothetical protein OFM21_32345, partial [Escherichia coli]|nr:hypothetical protein [Escherichia coli]